MVWELFTSRPRSHGLKVSILKVTKKKNHNSLGISSSYCLRNKNHRVVIYWLLALHLHRFHILWINQPQRENSGGGVTFIHTDYVQTFFLLLFPKQYSIKLFTQHVHRIEYYKHSRDNLQFFRRHGKLYANTTPFHLRDQRSTLGQQYFPYTVTRKPVTSLLGK